MLARFIEEHWDNTIRELHEKEGTRLPLPYPYSSPTEGDLFRDMFYWDTYWINIGLLYSGRAEQAKNNINNMLYMINTYGLMPNYCREDSLKHSQPPVLSLMVRDLYDRIRDNEWLKEAYKGLAIEYNFWMTKRITPTGLNQYGGGVMSDNPEGSAWYYMDRTGIYYDNPDYEKIAKDMLAEGESGWDYTPRYNNHALEFIQIDLNSLLYAFEQNMAYFAEILENGESELWTKRAEQRKALINEYLWCEERGTFLDRNYVTGEWSPVFSGASYFSMMCKVATEEQAASMQKLLPLIEHEHGIACCEQHNIKAVYQWDYPNCWAPVQHVVIEGLKNYGYIADVKRLSKNYTEMLENCFELTGNLWEKYNAVDGTINVTNEYEMPTMLGWTAGVYLYCLENL